MHRIWFERPLPPVYLPLLGGGAIVAGPASATPGDPFADAPGAHALIAAARLRYDGAVMDRVPTLRVIARTGIGLDNVNIPDATARGIAVCYTPDAPTTSAAELAITMLLATAKHLSRTQQALRRGVKVEYWTDYLGLELHGLRLGLVGLGRIGAHVAAVARALGMRVSAYDPYVTVERAQAMGVELAPSLEALLRASDCVSLHLPLMSETRHLIDAERLAQMKPGAILINAARGGLVDEAALLAALDSGHLQGAGLDVFETEPPPPDHPLLQRDDVIATPHIGGATGASKDRLWRGAIEQALQVLRGERPPHLANPEVWRLD